MNGAIEPVVNKRLVMRRMMMTTSSEANGGASSLDLNENVHVKVGKKKKKNKLTVPNFEGMRGSNQSNESFGLDVECVIDYASNNGNIEEKPRKKKRKRKAHSLVEDVNLKPTSVMPSLNDPLLSSETMYNQFEDCLNVGHQLIEDSKVISGEENSKSMYQANREGSDVMLCSKLLSESTRVVSESFSRDSNIHIEPYIQGSLGKKKIRKKENYSDLIEEILGKVTKKLELVPTIKESRLASPSQSFDESLPMSEVSSIPRDANAEEQSQNRVSGKNDRKKKKFKCSVEKGNICAISSKIQSEPSNDTSQNEDSGKNHIEKKRKLIHEEGSVSLPSSDLPMENYQNENAVKRCIKKKCKSKVLISAEESCSLVSSEINCSKSQENGASVECDGNLKKKIDKVKKEALDFNAELFISDGLSTETCIEATKICDEAVNNLTASPCQPVRPYITAKNVSAREEFPSDAQVLENAVNEELGAVNGGNAWNSRENSFAHSLQCDTVFLSYPDKFDADEKKVDILVELAQKKRFECELCQRSYTRRDNLMVHKKTHLSQRNYQCSICDRSFNYKHVLRDHLRMVHSSKEADQKTMSFDCSLCKYSAKRKQDLLKHVNAVHGKGSALIYPCTLCSRMFLDSSNLRRHIGIVHLQNSDYVCFICGKSFHQADNLKKHMKKHNDCIHCCPVCKREFQNLHDFKAHLRKHAPKVGFNCPFCEYVLVSESDERLKRHIREIHQNKEYV